MSLRSDLLGFSGDVHNDTVVRVIFNRPTTEHDREDLLAAINGWPQEALTWIIGDNVGSSSIAIWAHMMGAGRPRFGWSTPSDAGDFDRCDKLLDAVPSWRLRLPEMASHGRSWSKLVEKWERIRTAPEGERYGLIKACHG